MKTWRIDDPGLSLAGRQGHAAGLLHGLMREYEETESPGALHAVLEFLVDNADLPSLEVLYELGRVRYRSWVPMDDLLEAAGFSRS